MADVLRDYKNENIDYKLKLTSKFRLEYVKRERTQQCDFLCFVEISWPLLRGWCEILESTSGEIVNYIDHLNAAVVDGWF